MTELVQKLVTKNSFDDTATFRGKGEIGLFKPADHGTDHLKDVGGFETAYVEIAPIAPTGPSPKNPQQIPPDARQTAGGGYAIPGKKLVGQTSDPVDREVLDNQLDAGAEDKATKMLEKALGNTVGAANVDNGLVEGTVADVTSGINAETDLDQLEAAEKDREVPRKGVLDAIKAERAKREAE